MEKPAAASQGTEEVTLTGRNDNNALLKVGCGPKPRGVSWGVQTRRSPMEAATTCEGRSQSRVSCSCSPPLLRRGGGNRVLAKASLLSVFTRVSLPWQNSQISESAIGLALGEGSVGYPQSQRRGRNKIPSEAEHRVIGRGFGLNGDTGTSEVHSPFPAGRRTWLLAEKTVKFGANYFFFHMAKGRFNSLTTLFI